MTETVSKDRRGRAKSADWTATTREEAIPRKTPEEFCKWKNCSVPDVRRAVKFSKDASPRYQDLTKFGRSLRLLGLSVCEGERKIIARWEPRKVSSTLCTRLTTQSVSLDYLRESVGKVCACHSLDESHRKLLAQAAYEQWYFKKDEELLRKKEEEKRKQEKIKEALEKEIDLKKEKSKDEFQKWARRKRKEKMKVKTEMSNERSTFMKTQEDIEKAFLKWKAEKDKELKKKKKKEQEEKEKKNEMERQKIEKKMVAEKAFEQWKLKQDDKSHKMEKEKQNRNIKMLQESELKKRREGSASAFLAWKKKKDKEIKIRFQQQREAELAAREESQIQMEERMYEAEQAFEEWLEQTDLRIQKHNKNTNNSKQKIPWLPP